MNIFKTSIYSAISQITSVLVGLVSVKILAREIGPEGVAIQGQFINTTSMLGIFATGAIGQGVIKYLSEYTGNRDMQLKVINTAFWITLPCSLLMALVSIFGAHYFAADSLKIPEYASAYWIYGLFLPLISLNLLFTYILNGIKKIPILIWVNIAASCINLVLLILLVKSYHVFGVLITASFLSVIIFGIHLFLFNRYKWFSYKEMKPQWDKGFYIKLFKYSSMSLLAGFGAPFAQLLIRDRLIETISYNDAGLWQTITRISDFYLSFIVSVLSIYFLPKLSELKDTASIRKEIYSTAKLVFPIVIFMAFMIWLCRDIIISILLTDKFVGVRDLFHYQFAGDVFKVGGWLLSNILWAKAMTRKYLLVDGLSLLHYVLISFACIHYFGLIGATIGFCISYFIYFVTMIVINKKYLF